MSLCVELPSPDRNEYNDIDLAIAARLQPLRDYLESEDILVRALPDVAAGFGERTESGDCYFVLSSGRPSDEEGFGAFVAETWELTLAIMLPHRYTKSGIYDVFKRARNLLIGYKPPYCTKAIGAPNWQFTRDNAYWVIEAVFPFDVYILDPIPEQSLPKVRQLTIETFSRVEEVT